MFTGYLRHCCKEVPLTSKCGACTMSSPSTTHPPHKTHHCIGLAIPPSLTHHTQTSKPPARMTRRARAPPRSDVKSSTASGRRGHVRHGWEYATDWLLGVAGARVWLVLAVESWLPPGPSTLTHWFRCRTRPAWGPPLLPVPPQLLPHSPHSHSPDPKTSLLPLYNYNTHTHSLSGPVHRLGRRGHQTPLLIIAPVI